MSIFETTVNEAARRIKRRLITRAGGQLPRIQRGWIRLARECGVIVYPDFDCRPSYEAELEYVENRGYWMVTYNPYAGARLASRYLCHELFELHAHWQYASLFDDLEPRRRFTYSGDVDPRDLRHRIAVRGERICFRK